MMADEAVDAVLDVLEAMNAPYMVTGSFASNVYGVARSTHDADIVLGVDAVETVRRLAEQLGDRFQLDPQMRFETVTMTPRFILRVEGNEFFIEFFQLTDDPHDQERFARRQHVQLPDRKTWLPTPEDVVITKLRWALSQRDLKDRTDAKNSIGTTSTPGAIATARVLFSTKSVSRSRQTFRVFKRTIR